MHVFELRSLDCIICKVNRIDVCVCACFWCQQCNSGCCSNCALTASSTCAYGRCCDVPTCQVTVTLYNIKHFDSVSTARCMCNAFGPVSASRQSQSGESFAHAPSRNHCRMVACGIYAVSQKNSAYYFLNILVKLNLFEKLVGHRILNRLYIND